MKKSLYSLAFALSLAINLNALPSVAICGWDGSGSTTSGDEFSFVLLRDFMEGEIIYFTEDEYSVLTGNFNTGEGHIAYTVPAGGLLENEVISITETSDGIFGVGCAGGTAVDVGGFSWSLVSDGLGGCTDEIYAYSASNPAAPWSSITEVHCFAWAAVVPPTSDQQVSLDWPNVITIAWNVGGVGGQNADLMNAARVNTTLAMLQNGANWLQSTSNITLSCTDFTNQMLPIELVSFDVTLRESEVLIEWITASEVNNDRFEIEHSTDGIIYTSIGTIAGKGTSYNINYYQMVHHRPELGINYYRLKQMDYDGAYSYSEIETIKFYNNSTTLSVYPNPFIQDVTIRSHPLNYSEYGKMQTIEVFDIYGKLALKTEVPLDETAITIDLTKLNSGAYFLYMYDDQLSSKSMQRIIKL